MYSFPNDNFEYFVIKFNVFISNALWLVAFQLSQNAYANHGPGSAFSARSPAYNANPDVNQSAQSFPTRLNQQLSNMHLNAAGRGQGHGGPGFTPQSPGFNPQSPAYNPAGPGFNPQSPGYVPQSPSYNPAASPTYGMTSPPPGAGPRSRTSSGGSGGARRPGGDPTSPGSHVPDAVLNMASRSAPDKKPWAYAPDADSIREQRDKVRRRFVLMNNSINTINQWNWYLTAYNWYDQ